MWSSSVFDSFLSAKKTVNSSQLGTNPLCTREVYNYDTRFDITKNRQDMYPFSSRVVESFSVELPIGVFPIFREILGQFFSAHLASFCNKSSPHLKMRFTDRFCNPVQFCCPTLHRLFRHRHRQSKYFNFCPLYP